MANSTDKIFLDGTTYVKFPITDSLYNQQGVFVDFTLDLPNWGKPTSSQIVGNFNSTGYGVFFENGIQDINDFTIVDSGNAHMFYFNQSGGLVSQRNFSKKTNPVNITAYVVDHLGYKYYFDQGNYICSKFDSNNLLINEFTLASTVVISNMVVDASGDVYFVDTDTGSVLHYTDSGEFVSTAPLDFQTHNNIVILPDNSIRSFFSSNNTRMLADVEGNYYNHFGVNLYRNGLPWFFVSPLFNSFGLDLEDNIWIVYEGNRIMKLNSDGVKQFDKTFHEFSSCDTTTCPPKGAIAEKVSIGFTTESLQDVQVVYTWVLLNESGYAVKLDENGVVLDCFLIANMMDVNAYPEISYDNIDISVNGDFTGFYARKAFTENRLTESYIVAKVAVQDLVSTKVHIHTLRFNASKLPVGEHRIGFIYDGGSGFGALYIDGAVVDSFQRLGIIYYDKENLPPVLIGAESGNYRAKKEELGIIDPQYFAGTIGNLVISKQYSELVQKARTLTPLNLEIATNYPISFKERVDNIFLFRPKGMYSSQYNLQIKNSGIDDDDVKEVIVNDILLSDEQVNPTQTKINKINWVAEVRLGNISDVEPPSEPTEPPEPPLLPPVALIIEVDTTLGGHTDNDQFVLKTHNDTLNELVIDWGDGTPLENYTGVEPPTHTYPAGGVYTIIVMGTLDSLYYNTGETDVEKITTISFLGGAVGTDHSGGLDEASNLTTIDDLIIPDMLDGSNMFGSSNISEITGTVDLQNLDNGEDMFYNNNLSLLPDSFTLPAITNGSYMFQDNNLTTLPNDMTLGGLVNGSYMFYNNSLNGLPDGMLLDNLVVGENMFDNNNISTLPTGMTLQNLESANAMFYNNNLTSLPPSLTLDSLTDGTLMFYTCPINEIPNDMTLDVLENGGHMFSGNNITTLPAGMTLNNLTNGERMFNNTLLTSVANLTLASLTNGTNMFNGVGIDMNEYSDLLIRMEAANPNSNVNFHGGLGSDYHVGAGFAREALKDRGWTITDGDLVSEYAEEVISDAPVGYWRLQESSGSVAVDEMGNHHGTYVGSPIKHVDEWSSIGEYSLSLDGYNDWVEMNPTTDHQPTAAVSIEEFVYINDWSNTKTEAMGPNTTDGSGYGFWRNINNTYKAAFYVFRNGGYAIIEESDTVNVLTSGWHHLVGTYDGRYAKFYIDGVLVGTDDAGGNYPIYHPDPTIPLCLGTDPLGTSGSSTFAFEGKIRDAAVYDYALTQTQITNHFAKSYIT